MKRMVSLFTIAVLLLGHSGCSAVMALKQPGKKNMGVLNAGTSRENVITYLGAPVSSEIKDGKKIEIYQFTQGYSGGVKAARATWHVFADIFTFFIWELVGMPTELIANGHKMTIKITYDSEDKVTDFTYLQQAEA